MTEIVLQLIQEHDPFYYELLPYYVVVEDARGTPAATRRRIHAGFEIDIYGAKTSDELPPPDSSVALAASQRIVDTVALQTSDSCSIKVIPFPSIAVLDIRKRFQTQAMLRIRISHFRVSTNRPVHRKNAQ
jgi:hypothetical protein